MGEKRPYIVTFIGDISILSAFIWGITSMSSLISMVASSSSLTPSLVMGIFGLLSPLAYLVASFGYLRLKRWGYWLLLTGNICFLAAAIISALQGQQQTSYIGIIRTVISLAFIIPTRKYFDNEVLST